MARTRFQHWPQTNDYAFEISVWHHHMMLWCDYLHFVCAREQRRLVVLWWSVSTLDENFAHYNSGAFHIEHHTLTAARFR